MTLRTLLLAAMESPQRFPYSVLERPMPRRLLSERIRNRLLLVDKPAYAFGVGQAARLASGLGLSGLTAVEFGVAGGNGLLAMSRHADRIAAELGIEIDVVGFDNVSGLPPPKDVRDLPYVWSEGFYEMDEERLRARLGTARLVLGDVADTVTDFIRDDLRHPVGFISFDLDYYSSTVDALRILDAPENKLLPRVTTYFDDIGTVEWIGERAAISEFNSQHINCKIGRLNGLRDSVPGFPGWADQIFEAHLFEHPSYRVLLTDRDLHQMPLRP